MAIALTNLDAADSFVFTKLAQTRTTVVTCGENGATTPYSAYFTKDADSASWLTISYDENVFSIDVTSNKYKSISRSATVTFYAKETVADSYESRSVTLTQNADTVTLSFAPSSVSLPYTVNASTSVTVVPNGITIDSGSTLGIISSGDWLTAVQSGTDTILVTLSANNASSARSGTVSVSYAGYSGQFVVTQAANQTALAFDKTDIAFDAAESLTQTAILSGIPSGDATTPAFTAPSWITCSYDSATNTLTLVAAENTSATERNDSITARLYSSSATLAVSQTASASPNGALVLNPATGYTFLADGESIVVSATSMPTDATVLYAKIESNTICPGCTTCDDGDASFLTLTRSSSTAIKVEAAAQDVDGTTERTAVIMFLAGSQLVYFNVTQPARPERLQVRGLGDKFVKTVTIGQTPVSSTKSLALKLYRALQTTGWTKWDVTPTNVYVVPKIVDANFDSVSTYSGNIATPFEAFKTCNAHTTDGTNMHSLFMGSAAYRISFDATVLTALASNNIVLDSISFSVRTDGYNTYGLRIAMQIVDSTTADIYPATDWSIARGENVSSASYKKACVAHRVLNTTDNLYYGTNELITYSNLAKTLSANTRIFIYISLENYNNAPNSYLRGSGCFVPEFHFGLSGEGVSGISKDTWVTTTEEPDAIKVTTNGGSGSDGTTTEVLTSLATVAVAGTAPASITSMATPNSSAYNTSTRELFYANYPSEVLSSPTTAQNVAGIYGLQQLFDTPFVTGNIGNMASNPATIPSTGMLYRELITSSSATAIKATAELGLISAARFVAGTASYAAKYQLALAPYVIPIATSTLTGTTPTRLYLTNGTTALNLGNLQVAIVPWWQPASGNDNNGIAWNSPFGDSTNALYGFAGMLQQSSYNLFSMLTPDAESIEVNPSNALEVSSGGDTIASGTATCLVAAENYKYGTLSGTIAANARCEAIPLNATVAASMVGNAGYLILVPIVASLKSDWTVATSGFMGMKCPGEDNISSGGWKPQVDLGYMTAVTTA